MKIPTEIPTSGETLEVARWIWANLVPKSGQADSVQGELLRAIEKLRDEANRNGNINWDSGFVMLIDFLEDTFAAESAFPDKTKRSIHKDLRVLRNDRRPYLEDDLYDRLTEHVVAYCRLHPKPIRRKLNPDLHR